MLSAKGSPLIAGSNPAKEVTVRTQKVKILRAFYYGHTALKVGEVVELPYSLAAEALASHRAELADDKVSAPVVEIPVEPEAESTEPRAGRRRG